MNQRIAVIGAGLMGVGITQLLAAQGRAVSLFDPIEKARIEASKKIRAICEAIGDSSDCLRNVSVSDSLEASLETVDFVIEAAPEKLQIKQDIFSRLARVAPPDAILATNSSVIPVTSIAAQLDDNVAKRVVGMHFWNPPYLIPLVEVIQGERTSAKTVQCSMDLLADVGKEPVHVKKDIVVGNRVHHALWREAISLVAEGAIDAAGIDLVIKKSFGLRLPILGPLENADLIGIELAQDVHREVFPHLSNETEPNPILQEMLDAGTTGMSSGQGFYSWTPKSAAAKRHELTEHLLSVTRNRK